MIKKGINTEYTDLMPEPDKWLRKDVWGLKDAVCLLKNFDPSRRDELLKKSKNFKEQYYDDLDTARKAEHKSLDVGIYGTNSNAFRVVYAEVSPKVFIQWASSKGYEIPKPFLVLLETDEKVLVSNSLAALRGSDYWSYLEKTTCSAIEKFPSWRDSHKGVLKKEDIVDWLNSTIRAKTTRDADIIKKVLTDVFKID